MIKEVFSPFSSWKTRQALKLIGLAHSGESLELVVGDNRDYFGVVEYDEYVDMLPLIKWCKYTECEALKNIINECKKKTEIFGITNKIVWDK